MESNTNVLERKNTRANIIVEYYTGWETDMTSTIVVPKIEGIYEALAEENAAQADLDKKVLEATLKW